MSKKLPNFLITVQIKQLIHEADDDDIAHSNDAACPNPNS
jgi:hypothetical protein